MMRAVFFINNKMRIEKTGRRSRYRRDFEHENCGIGFVAHLKGKKSHSIIKPGARYPQEYDSPGS
ncbi:MAG: hypothetical protein MZV63_37195 [Marinilabiliales bacterium]|nr:hypothetical protein [Marinilabiliales bacterium]